MCGEHTLQPELIVIRNYTQDHLIFIIMLLSHFELLIHPTTTAFSDSHFGTLGYAAMFTIL